MLSYGRQTIEDDDIASVVEALRSGMLTQGPRVEAFEEALASYTGARYAVVCSSGTGALHLACLAAGIGEGDGVLTSPNTFAASSNCALYTGALPFFADIDLETGNIDPDMVEEAISKDLRIKAVIPVHYSGLPCDMEEISRAARRGGLVVIEDACHALGASWEGGDGKREMVGAGTYSDMTVMSFHPVKAITTGEGGAITTNDRKLFERLKLFRNHGITKNPDMFLDKSGKDARWHCEMQALGFNYRLSDIQCALGISQLKKIDRFIARRTEIAGLFSSALASYPFIKTPQGGGKRKSAHHLYPIRIPFDEIGVSKADWFSLMAGIGFGLQVHYIPVHLHPYYRDRLGFKPGDFPRSERFYAEEVSLPIYPDLTDEEAGSVVEALISTLSCAATARLKAPLAVSGKDMRVSSAI
ncbi:MAG: UDP-4-amino-4,6-dideoxy-N-acetyl-beta-L-altrosamine transaminase [Deltaproteobacteria bacterium]|nr:UDP-4-amino-4,6-dideoxy-N-acetyl-beta-L-altrosamine transaminase [Deltaproteobacteria bacterium]